MSLRVLRGVLTWGFSIWNCSRSVESLRSAFLGHRADAVVINRMFTEFMVKDYVKSVKGTRFPVSFHTPVSQERMDGIVKEFVKLRGDLFTVGIVCKEYVDLAHYGGATNEWRAFYLDRNLLNVCRNSNQPTNVAKPPEELVLACSNLGSPYYTVDFAERVDGTWIVVETGDGQVSGLAAAQDPVIYYQVLADALERRMRTEAGLVRLAFGPSATLRRVCRGGGVATRKRRCRICVGLSVLMKRSPLIWLTEGLEN